MTSELERDICNMRNRIAKRKEEFESIDVKFDELNIAAFVKEVDELLYRCEQTEYAYTNLRQIFNGLKNRYLSRHYYTVNCGVVESDNEMARDLIDSIERGFFGKIAAKLRNRRIKKG